MRTPGILTLLGPGLLLSLIIVGCRYLPNSNPTNIDVAAAVEKRSEVAAASVTAAKEINRQQDESKHRTVIQEELDLALANLPQPTAAEVERALRRAIQALEEDNEEIARRYRSEHARARELEKTLQSVREAATREEERRASRHAALMLQTRIMTYAAIGAFAIGVGLLFFRHYRLGVVCFVIGKILLGASQIMARIPDWAYTTLFFLGCVATISIPIFMWWSYRVGLFQHPPEEIGEFKVKDEHAKP